MPPPVELTFTLTEKEFVRCVRSAALRHPLTLGLIAFLVLNGLLCLAGSPFVAVAGTLATLALLYLGYYIVVAPQSAYDRIRPPLAERPQHFRFSDSGVEAKGISFESRLEWRTITHYRENHDSIRLYIGGNFILLPKRAFSSVEQMESLKGWLHAKAGNR